MSRALPLPEILIWTTLQEWKYLHNNSWFQVRHNRTWIEHRNRTRCTEEGRKDSFILPHRISPKPGQSSTKRNDSPWRDGEWGKCLTALVHISAWLPSATLGSSHGSRLPAHSCQVGPHGLILRTNYCGLLILPSTQPVVLAPVFWQAPAPGPTDLVSRLDPLASGYKDHE